MLCSKKLSNQLYLQLSFVWGSPTILGGGAWTLVWEGVGVFPEEQLRKLKGGGAKSPAILLQPPRLVLPIFPGGGGTRVLFALN